MKISPSSDRHRPRHHHHLRNTAIGYHRTNGEANIARRQPTHRPPPKVTVLVAPE